MSTAGDGTEVRSAGVVLSRGFRLVCPACGQQRLFRGPFRMLRRCTRCDHDFYPETGYYVGAVYVNVAFTEGLLLAVFVVSFLVNPVVSDRVFLVLAIGALILPLLFLHHSKSLWLALDYLITSRGSSRTSE